jgi:hypothetical protein
MKKLIYFSLFFSFIVTINAQQASDYFPDQVGYKWKYKVTLLDSSINEIDSSKFSQQNLYFKETDFQGRVSKIVYIKTGTPGIIDYIPNADSLLYSFNGSDVFEYFKADSSIDLSTVFDLLNKDRNHNIFKYFIPYGKWLSVYRFAESINNDYTISKRDTTIAGLPIRIELIGSRKSDETISTPLGTLNCKKFEKRTVVSHLIKVDPLPPIPYPIFTVSDFDWIAQGCWVVKSYTPSIIVDLSKLNLGIGSFFIPGLSTELDAITSVDDKVQTPKEFLLSQNYPNPFNPTTKIDYTVSEKSNVNLRVFDLLGNEVAQLVNAEKEPGVYEVNFDATDLSGGVYIYQIKAGNFIDTKKMILLK